MSLTATKDFRILKLYDSVGKPFFPDHSFYFYFTLFYFSHCISNQVNCLYFRNFCIQIIAIKDFYILFIPPIISYDNDINA